VHITALPSDYYNFDASHQRLVGERSGRSFQLGGRVRVQVARVDLDDKKIDLELIDSQPPRKTKGGANRPSGAGGKGGKGGKGNSGRQGQQKGTGSGKGGAGKDGAGKAGSGKGSGGKRSAGKKPTGNTQARKKPAAKATTAGEGAGKGAATGAKTAGTSGKPKPKGKTGLRRRH